MKGEKDGTAYRRDLFIFLSHRVEPGHPDSFSKTIGDKLKRTFPCILYSSFVVPPNFEVSMLVVRVYQVKNILWKDQVFLHSCSATL